MAQITFNIDNSKIDKIVSDYVYLFPNTELVPKIGAVPDPDTGKYNPADLKPRYTDSQWVKEHVRRTLVNTIKRSRQKQQQDAITYSDPDGDIT